MNSGRQLAGCRFKVSTHDWLMAALLHDETDVLESVVGVRLVLEFRLRPFGRALGRAAFGPRLLDELRVRSLDIRTLDVGQTGIWEFARSTRKPTGLVVCS